MGRNQRNRKAPQGVCLKRWAARLRVTSGTILSGNPPTPRRQTAEGDVFQGRECVYMFDTRQEVMDVEGGQDQGVSEMQVTELDVRNDRGCGLVHSAISTKLVQLNKAVYYELPIGLKLPQVTLRQ